MGFLTSFNWLIERRVLRRIVVAVLAVLALVPTLGVQAGGPSKHRRMATNLDAAVAASSAPAQRWVCTRGIQRMVDAVIVSSASDPAMWALRAHVERLGGTVHARFSSVQALSVTLPTRAKQAIDDRSDVESNSPDRSTRRAASMLETVTGAATANVRTATGTGNGVATYSGLGGCGVRLATALAGASSKAGAIGVFLSSSTMAAWLASGSGPRWPVGWFSVKAWC